MDVLLDTCAFLYLCNVDLAYLSRLHDFPENHADPFDRLIITTALVRSIPVITNDPKFADFGVEVIW